MSIELTQEQHETLLFLWRCYGMDTNDSSYECLPFGGMAKVEPAKVLIEMGLAKQNPGFEPYTYITQEGANHLGFQQVIVKTPFDTDELTDARTEITRLTAENAALKDALQTADTGWSEAIGMIENMVQENYTVPEWVTSKDPWATAKEYKRRKDDIRKLYQGE